MKSKTSFFNKTVFWKDVTRFAPVWVLYAVLIVWTILTAEKKAVLLQVSLWGTQSYVAILYGLICGSVLFGDLFKTRLCNGLHAMPLRRESWFVTHYVAGLVFCIVPELLKTLILAVKLGQFTTLLPILFAANVAVFLFYFSIAVLCAQFTGKRFAMVLTYGLVCFLPYLILSVVEINYVSMLPGVVLEWEFIEYAMPFVYLMSKSLGIALQVDLIQKDTALIKIPAPAELGFTQEVYIYLAVIAVVGLLFAALALVMYRRRKLESAGDFITRPYLGVAFLILYTLLATLILGHILGFVVGFFTGMMLLRRTVRVFNKRNFAIFAVSAAVFAASIGLTAWDPLGVVQWTPKPENVKSVYVDYNANKITDPETIETAVKLHELACKQRREEEHEMDYVMTLTYEMKSGRTVSRQIYIDKSRNIIEALTLENKLRSSSGYLTGYESWESFAENAVRGLVKRPSGESRIVKDEDIRSLIQAIQKDSEAGRGLSDTGIFSIDKYTYAYELVIRTQDKKEHTIYILAYGGNTIAWIKENVYN